MANRRKSATDVELITKQESQAIIEPDADLTLLEWVLVGKYIKLNIDGKIRNCKIEDITSEKDDEDDGITNIVVDDNTEQSILDLAGNSTNAWLYSKIATVHENQLYNDKLNRFIAMLVIILQIVAYIAMALFLKGVRQNELNIREETCYGPNCANAEPNCLVLTTGSLCSVLLIGFLWADVVNTVAMFWKGYIWSPLFILTELMTAIACGFYVGLYSDDDFDAIGGAIGILFVHDLDEKVYASMELFTKEKYSMQKKILTVILWIAVSFGIAWCVACTYVGNESVFGSGCIVGQFECDDGDCIWSGAVCNGVKDCPNGEDEGNSSNCDYSLITCPSDTFFTCKSTGFCIPIQDQYNGVFDCGDWTDEGHAPFRMDISNDTLHVEQDTESLSMRCDKSTFEVTQRYPSSNDTYHKQWVGAFKCDNGQCIDAKYACDGIPNDCVDGSDEYPIFDKQNEFPFVSSCPYAALIKCRTDQVLCKINGVCIDKYKVCDGREDCVDGADERQCEYDCRQKVLSQELFQCGGDIAKINETHIILFEYEKNGNESVFRYNSSDDIANIVDFTTQNGVCVPYEYRCDGIVDCEDGSDEKLCGLFPCSAGKYRCATGECIVTEWLCDGFADCPYADDENGTICFNEGVITFADKCTSYDGGYACAGDNSTICIAMDKVCNDEQDCPLGDDEDESICKNKDTDTSNDIAPVSSSNKASIAIILIIVIVIFVLLVISVVLYKKVMSNRMKIDSDDT